MRGGSGVRGREWSEGRSRVRGGSGVRGKSGQKWSEGVGVE